MKFGKGTPAENARSLAGSIAAHVLGDEAASGEIIGFLRDPVRSEARRFLRADNIDYDDVVQETIIAVLAYLRKNEGFIGDLTKFAVTVVRNRCRNILNTQLRRRQVPVESLQNRLTTALFEDPLQVLLDGELRCLIQASLDDLGPDCRALLHALYIQEIRCKDMMAPLGLRSVHGVYRRRSVCLAKLNRIVKKRLGICSPSRREVTAAHFARSGPAEEEAMTTRDEEREFYECVDPDVGDLVSRHREPDLEPALRRRLENHLEICDACRWELELQNVVVDGLAGGALRIDPAARRDRASSSRWLAGAGGLALAASVALVFLMPPEAPNRDLVQRAAATELRFVRPVENEVVLDGRPRLSWTALPEAVMYRITLRGAGGGRLWADSTRSTGIRVPAAAGIPRGSRVRAFLEPVPADLAASRGVSVTFRTDGLGGFLAYRLGAAAGWLRAGGLAGLAMLITGAALRLRRRGSPGNAGQPPIA